MAKNGKEATKEAQQALQDHKEKLKNVGTWKTLEFEDLNHIRNAVLDAWDEKLKKEQLDARVVAAAYAKEADRAVENLTENPKFDKDNGQNDDEKQSRAEQAIKALTDKPTEGTPVLEKKKFWEQMNHSKADAVRNAINDAEPKIIERAKQMEREGGTDNIRRLLRLGSTPEEIRNMTEEVIKAEQADNSASNSNEKVQSGNQNSQQKNNSGSSQGKKSGGSSTGKKKNT